MLDLLLDHLLQDTLVPHRANVDRQNDRVERDICGVEDTLLCLDYWRVLFLEWLNPRLGRAKWGWRHSGRKCDALARSACASIRSYSGSLV